MVINMLQPKEITIPMFIMFGPVQPDVFFFFKHVSHDQPNSLSFATILAISEMICCSHRSLRLKEDWAPSHFDWQALGICF